MSGDLTETLPLRLSPEDGSQAKADLATHGFCLIEGALSPPRVRQLRERVMRVAEQEIADGTDYVYEGGATSASGACCARTTSSSISPATPSYCR